MRLFLPRRSTACYHFLYGLIQMNVLYCMTLQRTYGRQFPDLGIQFKYTRFHSTVKNNIRLHSLMPQINTFKRIETKSFHSN